MEYQHLSQDEMDDAVADALLSREREHFHYELNKQSFVQILADLESDHLPNEWPPELVVYKSKNSEATAVALSHDPVTYELVSKLQYRDRIRHLLVTTETEQAKGERTYRALNRQVVDTSRLQAAVFRVRERERVREDTRRA